MAISLNPSLLYKLYQHDSSKGGTLGGLISQENFNESSYRIVGNQVIVTEADGDTFTYDLSQIGEDATEEFFADALNSDNPIGQVQTTSATTTDTTTTTDGTNTDNSNNGRKTNRTQAQIQADLDALKERREKLEQEIKDNNGKIEDYKDKIDALYKEIEDTIGEYIDQAADITEDVKEQVKKATEKYIEKYKNGEFDSTKALHNALASEISNIMSAGAMGHLMEELERVLADKKAEVEPYIAEIETIEGETETIQQEIETITTQEGDLEEELEEAQEQAQQQSCEPQGFAITDADGAITQFDFFVDRDGNGDLTDASEFLGAQSYEAGGKEGAWAEMTNLDTNGDGTVDVNELEAGNVKVVKTTIDANGNKVQQAMSASEAFGQDSDLKISTTQHAENSESDVPVNFGDYANNELLGNFDVTLNGETYTGYQTADSMDYLNDNYNFTSGSAEGADSVFNSNGGTLEGDSITHRFKTEFKYDIESVVKGIDVSDSEDELLDYAEDICKSRGISFAEEETTGENADDSEKQIAGATAAQSNVMEDLMKLAKEFDFEIAA